MLTLEERRARHRERSRRSYRQDPEKQRARKRREYAQDPQKYIERVSRYTAQHPNPNRKSRGHRWVREHPERLAFLDAQRRCTNPKVKAWKYYGGRGIEFRFTSFDQFFAELGPRPEGMSLDRKDNDGHYEPGNVRWATPSEQNSNKRRRVNA